MKITVTLKDLRYCDGCFCLKMRYHRQTYNMKSYCPYLKVYLLDWDYHTGNTIRPKKCIEENEV